MFLLQRPAERMIERFLYESKNRPFSYSPINLVDGDAPGYDVDETMAVIGQGKADFARARSALLSWSQFDIGWVQLFPRNAAVAAGTAVAVLARHLGFWSLNGCRVAYVLDSDEARFGFAYGTLTNHVESGEELFEVVLDAKSGSVTYRIHAVSQPRAALARIGYPMARVLQARFRRDSVEAMRRITTGA